MKYLAFLLLLLGILSSCEKILFGEDLYSHDPKLNFDYLWNECNEKYAYFELKDVDWDAIRVQYATQLYDEMSDDSLFNVLGAMLSELRDDHANLFSDFNTSFYGVSYTAQDNFDWRIIVDHYISTNYYITGPFSHNFIENQQIGYIRLSSFSEEISDNQLDFILDRYKDTQGLVLDLRENGGGSISSVFKLLSRFITTTTTTHYSVIKTGTEHDDFSVPEPVIIHPHEGIQYSKNIAVLTGRGTYSSGSLLCLATKALPNMFMVGDTTGGGLGMANGGQLPNGWTYRFSVTQSLTLDKKADFEQGVPTDIHTLFDWNNLTSDEILERAIDELLQ